MKWALLIFIFIFAVVAIQIYQNVEVVRDSYNVQKLQMNIKTLEKENELLREKFSHSLSLRSLEKYAREELGLSDPYEVKLVKQRSTSREEKMSSSRWIGEGWERFKEWMRQRLGSLFNAAKIFGTD